MKATKQSAIISAYGNYYHMYKENIDENGWCSHSDVNTTHENVEFDKDAVIWRPISLKGIEDNNGWESVQDENTAAVKDDIYYDLYDAENNEILYGVQGVFFVLSLIGMPCITHIRISNNNKPLYI